MSSRLIAVGVGPGDPELITVKGVRALREADIVIAPTADPGSPSIARGIVRDLVDPKRQHVIEQVYPMQRDAAGLEEAWAASAREVAALVSEGLTVAFVTLGDPSLYSTFRYLHRHLRRSHPEVPVEIVPGVSSIHAAAALADFPLALGDERLAILPATCEEERLRSALEEFDTVVLMKVSRVFPRLKALLAAAGLKEKAVYVRRVGLPEQTVVRDLDAVTEGDLDYLSLILVRKGESDE